MAYDDEEAQRLLNKLRDAIAADNRERETLEEAVAMHTHNMRNAIRFLPNYMVCKIIGETLQMRGDLDYPDLYALQYVVSQMCWEAMRNHGE